MASRKRRDLPSDLELDIHAFLNATLAKGNAASTVGQYASQLGLLRRWLERQQDIHATEDITPDHLRSYLLSLRERGLKPNTVHAAFRAIRRYLRWYERTQPWPEGWRNPLRGVEAPKSPRKRLPAPAFADLRKILAGIRGHGAQEDRDRALIMFMTETGVRSKEVLSLTVGDIEIKRRRAHIRETKSGRDRWVYFEPPVDKAIVQYMRHLPRGLPDTAPLWITFSGHHNTVPGGRLTYWGLRLMLKRRADDAGVPMPKLHGLRRLFATAKHEQGVTALDLQHMLGHADGQTLWRYVDISDAHLERVQRETSVVSRFLTE